MEFESFLVCESWLAVVIFNVDSEVVSRSMFREASDSLSE